MYCTAKKNLTACMKMTKNPLVNDFFKVVFQCIFVMTVLKITVTTEHHLPIPDICFVVVILKIS